MQYNANNTDVRTARQPIKMGKSCSVEEVDLYPIERMWDGDRRLPAFGYTIETIQVDLPSYNECMIIFLELVLYVISSFKYFTLLNFNVDADDSHGEDSQGGLGLHGQRCPTGMLVSDAAVGLRILQAGTVLKTGKE